MLALKQFRDRAKGVADLLNYASLIGDGLVLGKDGSLLAGFFYRGPDSASATPSELNYVTARINAALTRLGSGFALWVDSIRLPAAAYPGAAASHFPDPVTLAIDSERRRQFLEEGAHFETEYAFLIAYTPPLRRNQKLADLIYDDDAKPEAESPGDRQIKVFERILTDLEDALSDILRLRRMRSYSVADATGRTHLKDELVTYLHFALTGHLAPLNVPPCPMYLDAWLSGQELWAGDTPRIGRNFIASVAIEGFPAESYPSILAHLESLAIPFRFSSRFIPMDAHESLAILRSYRRKWKQWTRGFFSQVFKTQGGVVNEDAANMAREAENAITDANSGLVAFGFYTPILILMGEAREKLLDEARIIARELLRLGFAARVETVNTLEAFLGSLPGHAIPNIRRPLIHSLNFADLMPASSTWPGLANCPSPFFPKNSPPLLYGATTGSTPFRLNLHVGDVGHTLIFGPTGSGKSTLLATLAAQFRRYRGARITVFDKGRSLFALAHAAGGAHYDLAGDSGSPGLCPLEQLETPLDMAFAEGWLAACFELQQGSAPTPRQKEEIHRAVSLMRGTGKGEGRSLTDFIATVQDKDIRAALSTYTIEGALGHLLDARSGGIGKNPFTVFEIEELMGLGEKNLIPVLLYLFRHFERSLSGEPSLLLLDEAWVMLGHPVFREKIREWLKVLRKANCAVVLATQSLSDAVRSGILDVLLESCPTKILLPNEEADKGGSGGVIGPLDLYRLIGLNDTEIELLKTAVKKRHYYYTSPEGRRLFELGLGPTALAFTAVSSREDIAHIRALMKAHGQGWTAAWLKARGLDPETVLGQKQELDYEQAA
ncbi:MAG: transporter [Rhodomicrobium sp.]